jgi:hypothetical protein
MADVRGSTLQQMIEELRAGLVCDRCGRYVGSLGPTKYRPAPYPVALDRLTDEDEVPVLIGFERYMLALLREGKFTLRHPQVDGRCATVAEWAAARADED